MQLPFLVLDGENVGYSDGDMHLLEQVWNGQGAALARASHYRWAFNEGMNNPVAMQQEEGYTQPIQQFLGPANAMQFPTPTDTGNPTVPGLRDTVPTTPIGTSMPWDL